MIRRTLSLSLSLLTLSLASTSLAQTRATNGPTLPLRNVRLYEAGVGYFERSGIMGGGTEVSLPVPPAHLDDALKTLVVLSRDGSPSTVTGIELPSRMSAEMGRALAGLPEEGGPLSHGDLLRALQGAAVEVKTAKETVRGRLVEVLDPGGDASVLCPEKTSSPAAPKALCERPFTLLVLTDKAEVRRFLTTEVTGVRPTDPKLAARIEKGLDASSPGVARGSEKLRLSAKSSGEVTLGYVAEAPVWRSTYRMVLGTQDKATLQAWALLHNDTDEDWQKVHVELVNGRPTSFLFPLAAPRYARRGIVTPEEELSTVPQLLGRTVDDEVAKTGWGSTIGDSFGAGGLGLSGIGEGGGGRGEGIGVGMAGTIGHGAAGGGTGASTALSVGNLSAIADAEGVEAGALFRYALPNSLDLGAHGSALVPFASQAITATRIAFFAGAGEAATSAVRLRNDTAQTLPPGPIAFFDDGGFAGEAALARMKPAQTRIVSFGVDLDIELTESHRTSSDAPMLLSMAGGTLVEDFIRHHEVLYALENRSGSGRKAMLVIEYVENSKVSGADAVDFDAPSQKPLVAFDIGPRSKAERRLVVDEGLRRTHHAASLSARELRALAEAETLPEVQRAILGRAAKVLAESEVSRGLIPKRQADLAELEADLLRLQGHLASMRKDSDAFEEMERRMLAGEDRIKAIRTRIVDLGKEADRYAESARAELERLQ